MITCAEKDYLFILRGIAVQEIRGQISLGNPPSNIFVDNKKGVRIADAKRSVVAFFSQSEDLIKAISGARQMLLAYGRRVTGKTLGAMQYFQQQGKNGKAVMVSGFDPKKINKATDLYVGPAIVHVRKWQWLTRAGTRGERVSRNKLFKRVKMRVMVSKSVFETVAARMKSRYPRVDVLASYITVPNLNVGGRTPVTRIPVIKVRHKIRGRV